MMYIYVLTTSLSPVFFVDQCLKPYVSGADAPREYRVPSPPKKENEYEIIYIQCDILLYL